MHRTRKAVLSCLLAAATALGCLALSAAAAPPDYIAYSEYGAVGDGVTDDFDAIIAAHAVANDAGLPVRADPGAAYYIGDHAKTARSTRPPPLCGISPRSPGRRPSPSTPSR